MKCPICAGTIKDCPFCTNKKKYVIPETLIVIIQNVNQHYTKDERDDALWKLTEQFQYLLKKNTTHFYIKYNLAQKSYEYNDIYQDVLLEFYDLVVNDFKIKNKEENLAVFGNYIKNKLYHRVLYSIQEKLKKHGWKNELSIDMNIAYHSNNYFEDSKFAKEIYEATLANIMDCEEKELENLRNEKCIKILKTIYQISFNEKIFPKPDGEIWRLHWFSGKSVEQIDEYLTMEMEYKTKIGSSRIRQIIQKTNQKIIAEFGKVAALGDFND